MPTRLVRFTLAALLVLLAEAPAALAEQGPGWGSDAGPGPGRGSDAGSGPGQRGGGGSDDRSGPGWGQPGAHHPAVGYSPPPGGPAPAGRVAGRPGPAHPTDRGSSTAPVPASPAGPAAAAPASAAAADPADTAAAAPAAGAAPAGGVGRPPLFPLAGAAGALVLLAGLVTAGFRARARLGRLA